jgi:hypothetical protein
LSIDEKVHGEAHPSVGRDLNNLGLFYRQTGNIAAAEPVFRRLVELREKTLGRAHPEYQIAVRRHAAVLRALRRDREATAPEARTQPGRNRHRAPPAGAPETAPQPVEEGALKV